MSSCDIGDKPLEENNFSSEDLGQKAVMLYDGDCGFCLFWMKKWALWTENKIPYTTSQASGALFPQIPAETYDRAVVFVNEEGEWWEGAAAISASFEYAQTMGLFPAAYQFPPSRLVMDAGYRVVANNRRFFSKLTGFFLGKSSPSPQFAIGMRLFMVGLGLSFFFGFLLQYILA